jgi:hypothetical protein
MLIKVDLVVFRNLSLHFQTFRNNPFSSSLSFCLFRKLAIILKVDLVAFPNRSLFNNPFRNIPFRICNVVVVLVFLVEVLVLLKELVVVCIGQVWHHVM